MMFKKIFLITACVTLCSPLQALDYVYVAAASAGAQIAQDRNWWSVAATMLYTTAGYALLKFCYGGKKQTLQQHRQRPQITDQTDPGEIMRLLYAAYDVNDQLQKENTRLKNRSNDRNVIWEQNAAFQQARCQAALQEKDQEIRNLTEENRNLKAKITELESKPTQKQDIEQSGRLNEIMACLQRLLQSKIAEIKTFKNALGSILGALQRRQSLENLTFEQTPQ